MQIDLNKHVLLGKWKQIRGRIRQEWGRVSGHDLERAKGRLDQGVGWIQERYGSARARTGRGIRKFLGSVDPKRSSRIKLK